MKDLTIRIIQPPKLSKEQKTKISKDSVHKRIGLTQKQYLDNNVIKENEKEFVEQFTELGYKIKWITKRKKNLKTGQILPNNDFVWNEIEWECKSISNPKYSSISRRLRIPTLQGKKNIFLDMRDKTLSVKLYKQLASFNVRKRERRIERLVIWDKKGVKEIDLLEEK